MVAERCECSPNYTEMVKMANFMLLIDLFFFAVTQREKKM